MSGALVGAIVNYSASAIATPAVDVVAVFDQNYNQLFEDARPIKASIKPTAKLMESPVENGFTITDHRVINPLEIELNLILTPETYNDTYNQIAQTFISVNSVIVQTRTSSYKNMFIQTMPHEETADMFDTIAITLTLKETLIVSAQSSNSSTGTATSVASPTNAPTVSTGSQQGTTQTAPTGNGSTTGSTAFSWFYGSK